MLKLDRTRIENGGFTLTADLQIPRGARVAVIGPSGAGKSTLIEAIAGFLPLVSGRVLWEGEDLTPRLPRTCGIAWEWSRRLGG